MGTLSFVTINLESLKSIMNVWITGMLVRLVLYLHFFLNKAEMLCPGLQSSCFMFQIYMSVFFPISTSLRVQLSCRDLCHTRPTNAWDFSFHGESSCQPGRTVTCLTVALIGWVTYSWILCSSFVHFSALYMYTACFPSALFNWPCLPERIIVLTSV